MDYAVVGPDNITYRITNQPDKLNLASYIVSTIDDSIKYLDKLGILCRANKGSIIFNWKGNLFTITAHHGRAITIRITTPNEVLRKVIYPLEFINRGKYIDVNTICDNVVLDYIVKYLILIDKDFINPKNPILKNTYSIRDSKAINRLKKLVPLTSESFVSNNLVTFKNPDHITELEVVDKHLICHRIYNNENYIEQYIFTDDAKELSKSEKRLFSTSLVINRLLL